MAEHSTRKPARRRPTRPTPKPRAVKPPKGGPKVAAEQVALEPGAGSPEKGGGPDGEYWTVLLDGVRAGEVFVNVIDEAPIGRHASMQIFLNLSAQGKGVGRVAYRMAAEASRHPTIYLHMRKSNQASRLAAEAAGFRDATPAGERQLVLRWDRR